MKDSPAVKTGSLLRLVLAFLAVAAFAIACGGGGGGSTPTPTPTPTATATPSPTPGPPLVFTAPDFSVASGSAVNECFFVTATSGGPAAVRFAATPGSSPAGTDLATHLWVFTSPNGEPDGMASCADPDPAWTLRWTRGEGAGPFTFPSGVGSAVGTSETWVFRMHYVNETAGAISDSTRVQIDFAAPGTSLTPAGIFITGKTGFSIGANTTGTAVGTCTIPASTAAQLFAFVPEMNKYGTEMRVDATLGGAMSTPFDQAWDVANEDPIVLGSANELAIAAGDQLVTTCTYNNNTASAVLSGSGLNDEECFDFVYYYPAVSGSQYCGIP